MIIKQLTGPGKNSDLSNCVAYSDHAIFFLMYLAYAVFFSFTRKHPPDCGLRFLILAQPVFEGLEFLSRFLTNWFKIRAIPINKALCAPLSLPRWLRIPVYVTRRQNETITTNELAFI